MTKQTRDDLEQKILNNIEKSLSKINSLMDYNEFEIAKNCAVIFERLTKSLAHLNSMEITIDDSITNIRGDLHIDGNLTVSNEIIAYKG
jgi:filamentous hemagglutinin family protein